MYIYFRSTENTKKTYCRNDMIHWVHVYTIYMNKRGDESLSGDIALKLKMEKEKIEKTTWSSVTA